MSDSAFPECSPAGNQSQFLTPAIFTAILNCLTESILFSRRSHIFLYKRLDQDTVDDHRLELKMSWVIPPFDGFSAHMMFFNQSFPFDAPLFSLSLVNENSWCPS
jgi:hypothetical protein